MVVPAPTYKPPTGAQLISAGKGNNYYVYTENGTTSVVTTGGLPLATSTDQGKTYTFTSDGNNDANLQTALKDPQSSASKTVQENSGKTPANTAKTTETGDTNKDAESDKYDAEAIATTQKELDKLPSGISDGGSRTNYRKDLRYPKEIDTSNQDYVQFSMLKYEPTKINLSNAATKDSILSRSTSSQVLGTVSMSIQGPISDMNSVGYNDGNMNPLQALTAATALAGIGAGAEGAKGALSAVGSLISDTSANKALKTATKAYFAGQGIQNQELFTRTTGAIANPNIELLFNAPQLREFSFTFILSPRDKDESDEVRQIIRFFKQGMSVKKSSTGLFLKTPNTFLITYVQKGDDKDKGAKYLPKIKECALQSFGVDYTPAQTYSTYYNNSMTAYQLTMGFKELTPIYDNDYKDLDNDKDTYIGY